MKKYIPTILALLVSLAVFSQDCRYQKNEIDEFTGDAIKMTGWENLAKKFTNRYYFRYYLTKMNNDYVITMQLVGSGQSLFISKGAKLYLKLQNDEIITFATTEPYETNFETITGNGVTIRVSKVTPKYVPSKEQRTKISTIGLAKIRQETDNGYYEAEVSAKENKKLAQAIDCVL